MESSIGIRATGKDLKAIGKELRGQDNREIRRQLSTGLRAAAKPLVPAVRSSIANIPVKGPKHTGLRKRLQKAVTLRVRTVGKNAQVSILMSTAKMPEGQKALPAAMEGLKTWRHPVFGEDAQTRKTVHGNRGDDTWITQPARPYFYRTVRPMGAAAKVAVNKVTRDIERKIT